MEHLKRQRQKSCEVWSLDRGEDAQKFLSGSQPRSEVAHSGVDDTRDARHRLLRDLVLPYECAEVEEYVGWRGGSANLIARYTS